MLALAMTYWQRHRNYRQQYKKVGTSMKLRFFFESRDNSINRQLTERGKYLEINIHYVDRTTETQKQKF